MKKNKMMRMASMLLILVLLTTCTISGTFAKYTTSVEASDSARVAYWGFKPETMDISDLFAASYTHTTNGETVKAQNGKDVIAPGTAGSTDFAFAYDETVKANDTDLTMNGPEVDYNFIIAVEATCDTYIQNNKNIVWKLDDAGVELTWEQLIEKIVKLSGATSVTANANGTTTATVKYKAGWR